MASKRIQLPLLTRMQQPQFAEQIDWSNPITRNLCPQVITSKNYKNFSTTNTSIKTEKVTKAGIAAGRADTSSFDLYFNQTYSSSEWTFFALLQSSSSDFGTLSYQSGASFESDTNNRHALMIRAYNSSNTGLDSRPYSPDKNGSIVFPTDVPVFLVATINNTNNVIKLFVNGVNSFTAVSSSALASSVNMVRLFTKNGTTDPAAAGTSFLLAGFHTRALSDSEVQSLSANPWQVFK